MQLHKAFSSIINCPKIEQRKNFYNTFKKEKEFFETMYTPDDVNFAKDINKKIERQINARKMNNLRLLKRKNKNDIYSPNWMSNKNILRKHKQELNIKRMKLISKFSIEIIIKIFLEINQEMFLIVM